MYEVTWYTRLKGLTAGLLLAFSPFYGIIFMTGWMLPLLFINTRLYRQLVDIMVGWWFWYPAALIELFLGVKVKVTGDKMRAGESSLIVLNHRTRLDWMYYWSVLARQSGTRNEKIILKSPLKKIPGAGWAMQSAGFMFLNRRWGEDESYLGQLIEYFYNIKYKIQLLVFPEGTDFEESTKAASDRFAKKNGLQPYDYVLHPRTTGFTFLMEKMRQLNSLEAVYDVHVGYPKGTPQTEVDLCLGAYTEEVHFHIKRYDQSTLPQNKDDLEVWLKDLWEEKEKVMKKFYEDGHFEETPGDATEEERNEERTRQTFMIALVYWTSLVIASFILLYLYPLVRLYVLACIAFYVYMTLHGGFELFQAKQENVKHSPTVSLAEKQN